MTICVVVLLRLKLLVARRFGAHHSAHSSGHAVSVATWHLTFHEPVRVSHAQGPAGIERHLDKIATGCRVTGIAGVDGLG